MPLSLAEQGKEQHPEQAEAIQTDAALLRRLIAQDVEEKPAGGCQVNAGTEKDRVIRPKFQMSSDSILLIR